MKNTDLHIHSYFSDGQHSLETIVQKVARSGCDIFSVTDHNVLSDTDTIRDLARVHGICYLDGVEISTLYRALDTTFSLHVLGYSMGLNGDILNARLQATVNGYTRRALAIINKLNRMFPDIDLDFQAICGSGHERYVSRNTLARLIVEHLGGTISIKDALKQHVFLDDENDDWMMSTEDSFQLISDAGGVPILAHSGRELRRLGVVEYRKIIEHFVTHGLMGLEVHAPTHNSTEINTLRSIALEMGLYITGGSDWHGEEFTPNISIGVDVPDEDLAAFLRDPRISLAN